MSKVRNSEKINTRHARDRSVMYTDDQQKEKGRLRVRLIPIWLRLVLLIVFAIVALCIGAMIGFSVIGEGSPLDVFHVETWKHIRDIVSKGT